jgi:hypothetical protein
MLALLTLGAWRDFSDSVAFLADFCGTFAPGVGGDGTKVLESNQVTFHHPCYRCSSISPVYVVFSMFPLSESSLAARSMRAVMPVINGHWGQLRVLPDSISCSSSLRHVVVQASDLSSMGRWLSSSLPEFKSGWGQGAGGERSTALGAFHLKLHWCGGLFSSSFSHGSQ